MNKIFAMSFVVLMLAIAVPAYAKTRALLDVRVSAASSVSSSQKPHRDLACMQVAVEKRENAIIALFDTFQVAGRSALVARRDDLNKAWAITNSKDRNKAVKEVWKAFDFRYNKARKEFRDAKGIVWHQFRVEADKCKVTSGELKYEQQDMDS